MNEELDTAAAEYVLGTLPADERARLAARLAADPELRAAVRRWQARLAPLDATAPSAQPSAGLWNAIERATIGSGRAGAGPAVTNVVQLRRRLALWRGAALATGALAAGLAGFVILDRVSVPAAAPGGRYVAVVDTGGREPAMIAEVDTEAGLIRVRSLTAEIPPGRSLELWHVPEGQAARSLGVLQQGAEPQLIEDAVVRSGAVEGLIAVTVEPEGGSPTGVATGPIVYSGRLVPIE